MILPKPSQWPVYTRTLTFILDIFPRTCEEHIVLRHPLKKKRTLICNNTAMNYLRKLFFMHFLEAYEAPPNQTIWTGKECWAMLTTPPPTTIMTTQCDNQMPWDKQQRTAPNTNTVPRLLVLAESRSVRTAY